LSGSEDTLSRSLGEFGDAQMARDFVNCGNSKLISAGKSWASKHGYQIVEAYRSDKPIVWGSGR
jgi:hypothetical protein